jgi:hypothetical protein
MLNAAIPLRTRAVTMFANGADTYDISKALNIAEWRVLKIINEERAIRLGRLSPYFKPVLVEAQ